MARFTEEELAKLAQLSRIECTEEEKRVLTEKLGKVLGYIELLQNIDTEGVPPCNTVLENFSNVMREDAIGELLPREQFLANAPSHAGGMIRVPPVIKFNNS